MCEYCVCGGGWEEFDDRTATLRVRCGSSGWAGRGGRDDVEWLRTTVGDVDAGAGADIATGGEW